MLFGHKKKLCHEAFASYTKIHGSSALVSIREVCYYSERAQRYGQNTRNIVAFACCDVTPLVTSIAHNFAGQYKTTPCCTDDYGTSKQFGSLLRTSRSALQENELDERKGYRICLQNKLGPELKARVRLTL